MSVESNRRIVFQGWEIGFQKVNFTKMVREELGLGLFDGKSITDRVLAGDRVELVVSSEKYEMVAKRAGDLGAVVLTENVEAICR
jgi:ribosomal protein L7/L12